MGLRFLDKLHFTKKSTFGSIEGLLSNMIATPGSEGGAGAGGYYYYDSKLSKKEVGLLLYWFSNRNSTRMFIVGGLHNVGARRVLGVANEDGSLSMCLLR
jgi:hypothetical protein